MDMSNEGSGLGMKIMNQGNIKTSTTTPRLITINEPQSHYVKLNVGGALYSTTISTLVKHQSMLQAMFSGRMEVLTDNEGWVLIDRCGKHFGTILNFLRDGNVALPDCRVETMEILAEAKYYLIQVDFRTNSNEKEIECLCD
ncbi:unnamed protein product [Anisakis simplex]|uniref:BTB domain-containing protein n=1 Tax=Anisakis simplex TaxID=6269 RepID=A0A0M3K4R5_ANISI|nr:unnamed protein product [Anisakis simplex]